VNFRWQKPAELLLSDWGTLSRGDFTGVKRKQKEIDMSELTDKKIAFVGSGIIAGVMIDRLLKTGTVNPEGILATDVRPVRLEQVKQQYGVQVSADNVDAAQFGDVIFIAVPPNVVTTALGELRGTLREEQIIISLAVAVPIALVEEVLGGALAVVRVIPNTPPCWEQA
jgi:pyrroline-5-carboxylate reductase